VCVAGWGWGCWIFPGFSLIFCVKKWPYCVVPVCVRIQVELHVRPSTGQTGQDGIPRQQVGPELSLGQLPAILVGPFSGINSSITDIA
jgi:hypothetical protein